jgi:transcriptional regulator with GAF, ATPase, and Fis domain
VAEKADASAPSLDGQASLDGTSELTERLAREQTYGRELRTRSRELRRQLGAAADRSSTLAYQFRSVIEAIAAETASTVAFARLANYSIDLIPGAEHAAVAVTQRHRLRSLSATAPPAEQILEREAILGTGPAWEAHSEAHPVLVTDARTDPRWPAWSATAAECGVSSVLALPLAVNGKRQGVLSLLAGTPDQFDASDVHVGMLLAEAGSLAIGNVAQQEQYEEALAHRDVIGQAKGILMMSFGIDADEAFRRLVRRSQSEHVKVHELCRRVVEQAVAARRRPRPPG